MTRSRLPHLLALAIVAILAVSAIGQDRADLTVADFEGASYEPWVVEGNAFGTSPARGSLPGQMAVEGFEGHGLVNSFNGGDDSTGTLTSPPFRVERRFLNFLIGGGKYPGETCLDLLVDGVVVRSATGPNDRPGGSERLDWAGWDVADLDGKSAVLRVVDCRRGGWGHINVDQIVQSDRSRGIVATTREVAAEKPFLSLPVDEKAPMRRVKVAVDGKVAREFDIKLAEGKPGYSAFLDLQPFQGKKLRIETSLPSGSKALEGVAQFDILSRFYSEPTRPQFHFTSIVGWLNDPNGLVFFEGEYHLFYQHNPYGWDWGNMHWGHAVSPDLVHWTELPIAVYPRQYGDWAFSGSAVVDRRNTSGFGTEAAPPLVAAYTSTGRGECIIYSRDRGRTWTEFAGNPVIDHQGRDPRLLWHEPSKRWVMAVYDEEGRRRDVAFYSSPDLKAWTSESRIGGFYECPDLFELPVEGSPGKTLWVLSAANGGYLLGRFDGKAFTPETPHQQLIWYGNFYAAQTFSDEPKGRRVQIGWAQGISFPGQPFNQQMTVPCELTLRKTDEGVRMFARPVPELDLLRTEVVARVRSGASPGGSVSSNFGPLGDLFDIHIEAEVGTKGEFKLKLPRATLTYDVGREILTCDGVTAPLAPIAGRIKLRVLVDRGSIEVFGNDGSVAISKALADRAASDRDTTYSALAEGIRSLSIDAYALKSSWR